jgi:hypothetical protein
MVMLIGQILLSPLKDAVLRPIATRFLKVHYSKCHMHHDIFSDSRFEVWIVESTFQLEVLAAVHIKDQESPYQGDEGWFV